MRAAWTLALLPIAAAFAASQGNAQSDPAQSDLADQQRRLLAARAQSAAAAERAAKLDAAAKTEQTEAAKARAEEEAMGARIQQAQADIAAASARVTLVDRLLGDQQARLAAQQAEQARLQAEQGRQQAEGEKAALRERLRQQLNLILETRESARGLIVNMSDVLFDFNKYTLKPGTREKLAKVSGILLAYPGLKIQVEGHTDSVGSDEYNQKLSEQRAGAVRDYLVAQGVPTANISAMGFGKANPVASNDTAAGRQQNRRVELVVSGDPIGVGTTQQ